MKASIQRHCVCLTARSNLSRANSFSRCDDDANPRLPLLCGLRLLLLLLRSHRHRQTDAVLENIG